MTSPDSILEKYLNVEGAIHTDRSEEELKAFFGAFAHQGHYEDGLFTNKYRDFQRNDNFKKAYSLAVSNATAEGQDPHVQWRARVFEYFFKTKLGGTALELGTAHGFMVYFALTKMALDGHDLNTTKIIAIDKFNDAVVHRNSGVSTGGFNPRYATSSETTRKTFLRFPMVQIVEGLIPDVLMTLSIRGISFLHIDLNAAQPEVQALRMLWPELLPGSVVILDDYGFPDFRESQEQHDSLALELGYDILALPTGQGLIIK